MSDIKVYGTNTCPYCRMAEKFFDDRKLPYSKIDVSDDQQMRDKLVSLTGQRTVPQIFIDEKSIGGYSDLVALQRAGRLEALLSSPSASP